MRIKVWDLPTRVFHWTLFLAVIAAVLTGLQGGNWMLWHERAGLLILGLLVFRLIWGLLGSTYARFAQFFPTPRKILAYLRGHWHEEGHNPLGALSVFALLLVLLFQAVSGLFSNDDIAFNGPLYALVSKADSNGLSRLHRQGLWVILALVSLHILAVLYYSLLRRNNLIRPMLTGWKPAPQNGAHASSARGGPLWALLLGLLLSGLAVWAANGGLLPPPPPPPPASSLPSW
ncbi:MAG: cytochrome b/b6 domain-containing protein [Lamprobacter sp.]|uniref:cytochrome b/b6 domain-containing protein n=1 Tax=Lamprobacter sp. TaxID=3100796 RepID=UPI002B2611E1|nr:cytochrome b/b6 domain-containing protein [Lamprobacter sp.]MEA3641022.1 cytochrome b/b6 domain-containing protein [Lamprobacter sp.]